MDRKNIININGFEGIDINFTPYGSNPVVEIICDRAGKGYNPGQWYKIIIPLNQLNEIHKATRHIVKRMHAMATAMLKNLEDSERED
jgi:hypothetical protein